MANRYLKGTFTRNAWDFYEVGAAWIYGNYLGAPGIVGFIFNNNGISQSYLDIFRAEVSSAVATPTVWSIVPPGTPHDSIEPFRYFNNPVQLDLATPPGDMDVFTTPPGFFSPVLKARADPVTYDAIELANGGPFLTLPPLYGLAVSFNLSATASLTMSLWYQSITDHTPPAT